MGDTIAENVTWRLEDLYAGEDDPAIEADRSWCRKEADGFSAEYRGRVASLAPGQLLAAVERYEALTERLLRLASFAYLNFSTQTQNAKAGALRQSVQEFHSEIHRDTLFFELEWTQMDDEAAERLAASPELAHYRHFLESLRRYRPHMLSETEERLLAEVAPVGAPAWNTLFDKVLGRLPFGERRRTESEVLSDLHHPDRGVRKQAAAELTDGLSGVLHILTHIFNTILLDRSIGDRLRRYPHWLRSRNMENEADDAMVDALVSAVGSRYDLVHRYYRLKRRLLGYEALYDYDRYAPIPGTPDRTFSWEEARDIVLSAYESFSPKMAETASRFFSGKWIHAPVLPGKRSGAYSHSTVPSAHPYVFLNFTGTHRDVITLAHELGHGVHQFLAAKQGLLNADTPLTTAESASVFGETLVFRYLLGRFEKPAERLSLLCSRLEDSFATIFRQVAMNRFEEAVHNGRREKGELDADRIAELWMDTQRAMFADSVQLLDHYRIWWSYIPHFVHSPGYVYAYAFGELLVLALYQQYRETGSAFVPMYLNLLEAGGGRSPNELLRPFGMDLADPGFWNRGLNALEDLLVDAEREASGIIQP